MTLAIVAALSLSALAAGCGSSSPVTAGTSTTPTTAGALAYARCMRSHGVADFPDPTGGNDKAAIVTALRAVGDSRAETATTACAHVNGGSPGTGQGAAPSQARTSALVAFARCMRRRGLTSFPDPTTSGQLTQQMLASAGVDVHAPAVLHAADACASVTHGVITKATVARFVAGQ
jgi:hypothetical protein